MFSQRQSHYTCEEIDNLLLNSPLFSQLNTANTLSDYTIRQSIYNRAHDSIVKLYEEKEELLTEGVSGSGDEKDIFTFVGNAWGTSEAIHYLTNNDIIRERGSLYTLPMIDASLRNSLPPELSLESRIMIYNLAMLSLSNLYNSLSLSDEYQLTTTDYVLKAPFITASSVNCYPTWALFKTSSYYFNSTLACYPTWKIVLPQYSRATSVLACYPTWLVSTGVVSNHENAIETNSSAIVCYPTWRILIGSVHITDNEGESVLACYPTWSIV